MNIGTPFIDTSKLQVIEGELEITINGIMQRAGAGSVGIVPPNTPHSVTAISSGKAIVVDYPLLEASFYRKHDELPRT